MIKVIAYLITSFSLTFAINNNIYDIANYLDKKNLEISGEFYNYDFAGVPAHWDFVFKSTNGVILQLRGNPSTPTDLFGWKEINIDLSLIPDYYFIYLGDFDFDGDNRFDWILIQRSNNIAYKLVGSTINSTFLWSERIPVSFYISNNQVMFTKNVNIPIGVSAPTSSLLPTTTPVAPPALINIPTSSQIVPKIPVPTTNLEKPPIPPI